MDSHEETGKFCEDAKEVDAMERQYAEDYIHERLDAERKYYDDRADGYRRKYMNNQTCIIVLGALIPIITLVDESFSKEVVFHDWHLGSIANATISAIIAIIAGIDKLHQTQSRWNTMRYCAQMLRREKWFFRNRVGKYSQKSEKEAKQLLVQRTEDILYFDISNTLKFAQNGSANSGDNEVKESSEKMN